MFRFERFRCLFFNGNESFGWRRFVIKSSGERVRSVCVSCQMLQFVFSGFFCRFFMPFESALCLFEELLKVFSDENIPLQFAMKVKMWPSALYVNVKMYDIERKVLFQIYIIFLKVYLIVFSKKKSIYNT